MEIKINKDINELLLSEEALQFTISPRFCSVLTFLQKAKVCIGQHVGIFK
jgi:hypothetical protein